MTRSLHLRESLKVGLGFRLRRASEESRITRAYSNLEPTERGALGHWHVWVLVAVSLSLNLYGIDWGLPNGDQDWANDSLAPVEPLAYLKRIVSGETWFSKYPPFHYMVLVVFYAPYAVYLYLTGGITSPASTYPYGLTNPDTSLMVLTLIARGVSAAMGTGTVLINYFTVRTLYGSVAGFVCGLLLATSCGLIYYSHNANVDGPQLFWISLALYSFVRLMQTYETKHYVLLALFSACAIGTKNSAFALFLGLAVPLLWFHLRHHQDSEQGVTVLAAALDRKLILGFVTFLVTLVIVFNLPLNWQGFLDHIEFHLGRSLRHGKAVSEAASVQRDLVLLPKYLNYLIEVNGAPVFLLLAAGFLYCLFKVPGKSWPIVIPIVAYYLFFIRMTSGHSLRYVLPIFLLLTWHAGKCAADLLSYRRVPRGLAATVVGLVLIHSFLYGFSLDLLFLRDSRYAAERWMKKNIPSGSTVEALSPLYSLPRFPKSVKVTHVKSRRQGKLVGALGSNEADYLVLDMGLEMRTKYKDRIHAVLEERGFCIVASFKSDMPLLAEDIFHAVNPDIAIFQAREHATRGNVPCADHPLNVTRGE